MQRISMDEKRKGYVYIKAACTTTNGFRRDMTFLAEYDTETLCYTS